MYNDRAWGFTLIELLIVVAIIAILAAIAAPNLLEAQTRSKSPGSMLTCGQSRPASRHTVWTTVIIHPISMGLVAPT